MFIQLKNILDKLKVRVILDNERLLGNHGRKQTISFNYILNKEELSRKYIFSKEGTGLRFLDVGGRDGELTYLLSIKSNLKFDEKLYKYNKKRFDEKFIYYGIDLDAGGDHIVQGDICSATFLKDNPGLVNFFDVVYSNNVFEHLKKPWIAARTIVEMMKPGGICITIAPFSLRYHESPVDYFRYTHTGLAALFEDSGKVKVLESGYDIIGRRNNWQGTGTNNDLCPEDKFGAWRENWFVVSIVMKT